MRLVVRWKCGILGEIGYRREKRQHENIRQLSRTQQVKRSLSRSVLAGPGTGARKW
jgi:hypothetical protein